MAAEYEAKAHRWRKIPQRNYSGVARYDIFCIQTLKICFSKANWIKMVWICRRRFCQDFKFRFLESLNSQNLKLAPPNQKLDRDFEFWFLNSIFKNPKSVSPIPLESHFNPQIWIQRPKLPPKLYFRFKIQIFLLRPKSWFCIRLSHFAQRRI